MKQLNRILLFCIGTLFIASNSFGQANPFINVLPSNSGIVTLGDIINIEVTIGNTGPISDIPQAKLRPIIQVPSSVTFLPNAQQIGLPAGWTILSNTGSQLRLCNSTDPIQVNTTRTIILKVQGVSIAPAQTFAGNINFGNGTTCAAGPSVFGDQITDNAATSTIQVVDIPLPLTLINFSVQSENCSAYLNWSTSNEINVEKFDIENSETDNVRWKTVGSIMAKGTFTNSVQYSFKDESILNTKQVLYRLKIVDIDGSIKYSPVLNALLKCDNQYLSVFPNPVTNGKFSVGLNSTGKVEAHLTSLTGQLIKRISLDNGINTIDVSELSNGMYILSTKFENGNNQNVKVNVQK